MPPDSSAVVDVAAFRRASPPAAAITVNATMMAITHGTGPESRDCGISCPSPVPAKLFQPRAALSVMKRGSFMTAAPRQDGAADSAAPRWDQTGVRDPAA